MLNLCVVSTEDLGLGGKCVAWLSSVKHVFIFMREVSILNLK